MIHAILSKQLDGSRSPRSFNNDIGLPLTLLNAQPEDDYVVCEMGTSSPGEIEQLARIARPDIAVITGVGHAHMENFASLEDVASEDAAVFRWLKPGGTAVVPADTATCDRFLSNAANLYTFGSCTSADVRVSQINHQRTEDGQFALHFTVNESDTFDIPLIGAHNAINAAAAIAVAHELNTDSESISKGLHCVEPADMRMNHRLINGVDLLLDCYNSNPESAAAGISTFAELFPDRTRRVLVIGDMLELGAISHKAHTQLAQHIESVCPARHIFTIGPESRVIARHLARAWSNSQFDSWDEVDQSSADAIARSLQPDDAVYFKGSRAMHLEDVAHRLAALHEDKLPLTAAPAA